MVEVSKELLREYMEQCCDDDEFCVDVCLFKVECDRLWKVIDGISKVDIKINDRKVKDINIDDIDYDEMGFL